MYPQFSAQFTVDKNLGKSKWQTKLLLNLIFIPSAGDKLIKGLSAPNTNIFNAWVDNSFLSAVSEDFFAPLTVMLAVAGGPHTPSLLPGTSMKVKATARAPRSVRQ